jgi:DNA-binding transcriptional LysR family regulator
MRFNRLDLNQLVALDALLSEQSVSRAAERIFLSQSAMSNSLTRLREYYEDELLIPVGRKMIITPLGQRLLPEVRELLVKIYAVTQLRETLDISKLDRELTLIVSDYASAVFMPLVLRLASIEAPGIKIHIKQLDNTWREQLERGEVDVVIIPDSFKHDGHPSERLFEDKYCCVVWKENPELHGKLTLDDYHRLGHVVAQISEGRTTLFDQWFLEQYGQVRRVEVKAPYFSLLPVLVAGTSRIATVHYQLAKLFQRMLPIDIYEIPFDVPNFVENIQYHKHFGADPVTSWFRNLLHQVAKELMIEPN